MSYMQFSEALQSTLDELEPYASNIPRLGDGHRRWFSTRRTRTRRGESAHWEHPEEMSSSRVADTAKGLQLDVPGVESVRGVTSLRGPEIGYEVLGSGEITRRSREEAKQKVDDLDRVIEAERKEKEIALRRREVEVRQKEEARRKEEDTRQKEVIISKGWEARNEMKRNGKNEEDWVQGTGVLSASWGTRSQRLRSGISDMKELVSAQEPAKLGPEPMIGSPIPMNWWSVFRTRHSASRRDVKLAGERLSKQQIATFGDTRERVIRAVKSVLGKAVDITHEVFVIGADLLDYAPIPALAPVAHILLDIWDAFQQVQSSRFASIRLVERCASILICVREEVASAGNAVSEELKHPVQILHESFGKVLKLLRIQLNMPFLKRFLGREQMLQNIEDCDASLTQALWMLGFSIQIRTLKLIQNNQRYGLNMFGAWKQRFTSKTKVRDSLEELCRQQNLKDRQSDFAELRQLLRTAVQTTDDAAMVEILQIGRDEMPEAMRALEHTLNNYNQPAKLDQADDDLDRRFMENGVEALRRLTSQAGMQVNLPSWTISRFEIDLDRRIGVGLFSNVYKGSWRNRVVAIKMLADATPRKLFVHEAEIWKSLSHPHIVQLLGASSTSSEPPWFFVSPYYRNGNLVKYLKDLPTLKDRSALRMMQEISAGMAHLHQHGVLHGDLKAVNVLVDDGRHCVITDFGQSELKSEVYRVTRQPISRGTLRWQAPELMRGATSLTQEMDVYAFAITCVEVITKGSLPWLMQDDADVRHAVLVRRERPSLSSSRFSVDKRLTGMFHACWHQEPSSRPPFSRIFSRLSSLSHALSDRVA